MPGSSAKSPTVRCTPASLTSTDSSSRKNGLPPERSSSRSTTSSVTFWPSSVLTSLAPAGRSSGSRFMMSVLWRPGGTTQRSSSVQRAVATMTMGWWTRLPSIVSRNSSSERVRPVDVAQDDHDRALHRAVGEHLAQRPPDLVEGGLRLVVRDGRLAAEQVQQGVDDAGRLGEVVVAVGDRPGEQGVELGRHRLARVAGQDLGDVGDGVGERAQRVGLPVGHEAALEHQRVVGGLGGGGDLLGQPALAHPALAEDEEQVGAGPGHRGVDGRRELEELDVSAHERGLHGAGPATRRGELADRHVDVERLGPAPHDDGAPATRTR